MWFPGGLTPTGMKPTRLTKAFEDITGIKVVHEITGEDDVIRKSHQMDLVTAFTMLTSTTVT